MTTKETLKQFLVTDKSGRSAKPYKLDANDIELGWDLLEEDWDSEQTLGEYLGDCEVGDKWCIDSIEILCIK